MASSLFCSVHIDSEKEKSYQPTINFVIISQYKLIKDKVCPWGKRNFTFYYYYDLFAQCWRKKRPQFFTQTLFTVTSALSTYLVCFFSTFMENG